MKEAKKIIILALLLALLTWLSACSPGRRLERILNRHPELIQKDSSRRTDTVILPRILSDTIINWQSWQDTVFYTIEKDRLKIQVKKIRDTLYIRGESRQDTLWRTRHNAKETIIVRIGFWEGLKRNIVGLLFFLALVYLVVKFLKRR